MFEQRGLSLYLGGVKNAATLSWTKKLTENISSIHLSLSSEKSTVCMTYPYGITLLNHTVRSKTVFSSVITESQKSSFKSKWGDHKNINRLWIPLQDLTFIS